MICELWLGHRGHTGAQATSVCVHHGGLSSDEQDVINMMSWMAQCDYYSLNYRVSISHSHFIVDIYVVA